ncbi:MAG: hypothetical protein Dbin4_02430, partial [Alphaproteobacteria bacterium]|nr:hypothetical protein [Alphaproteobacteria bacterium]
MNTLTFVITAIPDAAVGTLTSNSVDAVNNDSFTLASLSTAPVVFTVNSGASPATDVTAFSIKAT